MRSSGLWIEEASQILNTHLQRHAFGEATGPHPGCSIPGGHDRLVVFEEGNWWCRQCGEKGWWADPPPKEEIEKRKEEQRLSQLTLVKQMHACNDWLTYAKCQERIDAWHNQGMNDQQIARWGLGFCSSTPIFGGPSLSIPVFYQNKLWDIRHRLLEPTNGAKYTSHLPHLTPPFFNLDSIQQDQRIYVTEGEKKCIAIADTVKAVVGVPGQSFYRRLVPVVQRLCKVGQELVFIPDPGTIEKVAEIAPELGVKSYCVELWSKPDDFLHDYGADSFLRCLEMRRPL